MLTSGWLFDVYPSSEGMVVWIVDEAGRSHRFAEPFQPRFYATGTRADLRALARALGRDGLAVPVGPARRREFWSGEPIDVIAFALQVPERQRELLKRLAVFTQVCFYDCDLPLPLLYFHHRKAFPLARCTIEHGAGGRLLGLDVHGSPWETDYSLPDLAILELRGWGDEDGRGAPLGKLRALEARCAREGYAERLDEGSPARLLTRLNEILERFDPHVLLTKWGDSYLIPALLALAERTRIPLALDRDMVRRHGNAKGHSYFSYGRILYQAPAFPLFGRWHLDRRNSFFVAETGLGGLLELSRLSRVTVQKLARTSPGTAITALQLDRALDEGILVPWKKGEPERWKTAWDLLVADKGGLVYQPILGLHESVAEIDFASMYPAMMVRHNISPETVGCACCPDARVPEIGIPICTKREGLVTRTLRPILEKRLTYKAMMKAATGERREQLDLRQTALKWILVCCFGYLGYRNARFGRIEAHEAVTAYGRETLLRARELCEAAGYRVLHAYVDSLWVRKPGATEADVLALCDQIATATGITIGLEGIYKWLVFLPSKVNPIIPVANRYFGAFRDDRLKIRGIDLRRSDTPPLVARAQQAMIETLAAADDAAGLRRLVPAILDLMTEYAHRIWEGDLQVDDLVVKRTASKEVNEYKVDSQIALASRQLADRGITVHAGEKIAYVITGTTAPDKGARVRALPLVDPTLVYDPWKYLELLLKATEAVLTPCGVDFARLVRHLDAAGLDVSAHLLKGQRKRSTG